MWMLASPTLFRWLQMVPLLALRLCLPIDAAGKKKNLLYWRMRAGTTQDKIKTTAM
jgi:hypothetical protein